jgi:hypothetical protein
MDPIAAWEFISDLLDKVTELADSDEDDERQFSVEGHVLLLDLVITILELDFTFAIQE